MATKRNRIIYASQSVWVDGYIMYRVQTLGATTTFRSEDIFELGRLDIVDVVDDVPAVAITLDTNEWGDVKTMAVLAQLEPSVIAAFSDSANSSSNLVLVSGTSEQAVYYNGVSLADFAVSCGNIPGVCIWAPVQDECSMGTDANNIDMTMFMEYCYVNSIDMSYTTGANATENYGLETDNKMWLLNSGRFVNCDRFTLQASDVSNGYVNLSLDSSNSVAVLTDGSLGFLKSDETGARAVQWYDVSANESRNIAIVSGTGAAANTYVYYTTAGSHRVYFPTSYAHAVGDVVTVIYAANAYGSQTADQYFKTLSESPDETGFRADSVGAVRQGQVEVYIVDPENSSSYDLQLRLTGVTLRVDLTREALAELGHLAPYDRPVRLPIPITVTVNGTAGDLETWAKFAGRESEYDSQSLVDLAISDLMQKDNLILVVMIYQQTDEEAGGTGSSRRVSANGGYLLMVVWLVKTGGIEEQKMIMVPVSLVNMQLMILSTH